MTSRLSIVPAAWLARRPSWVITVVVLTSILAFFAVWQGIPWTDEIFYVDPGACLAMGRGFISNDYDSWSIEQPWGLSNPGLPLLIAGWFKLFGVGQFQSHLFFLLVYVGGLVGLSSWLARRHALGLVGRLSVIMLGLTVHALAGDSVYHARHDCFWPLLFWWFLRFSLDEEIGLRRRFLEGVVFGVAEIFVGLQFGGFFALAAMVLFLARRTRARFIAGIAQAVGLLLGLGLLRVAYGHMGVWDHFVRHRSNNFGHAVEWSHLVVSKDFWLLGPALLCLLLCGFWQGGGRRTKLVQVAMIGLGLFLLVPPAIHIIGYYQAPYSWMVAAPVLLIVLPVVAQLPLARGGWFVGAVAVMMLAEVFAAGRDLVAGIHDYSERQSAAAALVRLAPAGEPVLVSLSLYYDIRQTNRRLFIPFNYRQPPSPEVIQGLRWMVVTAVDEPLMKANFEGEWERVYSTEGVAPAPRFGHYFILQKTP